MGTAQASSCSSFFLLLLDRTLRSNQGPRHFVQSCSQDGTATCYWPTGELQETNRGLGDFSAGKLSAWNRSVKWKRAANPAPTGAFQAVRKDSCRQQAIAEACAVCSPKTASMHYERTPRFRRL